MTFTYRLIAFNHTTSLPKHTKMHNAKYVIMCAFHQSHYSILQDMSTISKLLSAETKYYYDHDFSLVYLLIMHNTLDGSRMILDW